MVLKQKKSKKYLVQNQNNFDAASIDLVSFKCRNKIVAESDTITEIIWCRKKLFWCRKKNKLVRKKKKFWCKNVKNRRDLFGAKNRRFGAETDLHRVLMGAIIIIRVKIIIQTVTLYTSLNPGVPPTPGLLAARRGRGVAVHQLL